MRTHEELVATMLGDPAVRAEYDAHLRELEDAGQIGAPRGGDESTTLDGLDTETEGAAE